MLRHFITIQLLLSLLGSGLAQASSAGMPMPVANDAAVIEAVVLEDMPPCHQAKVLEQIADKTDMDCCDNSCPCEALCQSLSLYIPGFQQTWPSDNTPSVIGFAAADWATIPTTSLYRPPIR
jgi:hypothetical protein